MIISFHSRADKTRFHTNGSAPGLILVKRLKVIQKWPIAQLAINVKYI